MQMNASRAAENSDISLKVHSGSRVPAAQMEVAGGSASRSFAHHRLGSKICSRLGAIYIR
jgi:hypothetical protein